MVNSRPPRIVGVLRDRVNAASIKSPLLSIHWRVWVLLVL